MSDLERSRLEITEALVREGYDRPYAVAAVDRLLAGQCEAIAQEIHHLSPGTSAPDRYRDGMEAAAAIARDFGKGGVLG